MISESLGRKIVHKSITEDEAANIMQNFGIPADYARILAELDTYIKEGKEARMNDTIYRVTEKTPRKMSDFVEECIQSRKWVKD